MKTLEEKASELKEFINKRIPKINMELDSIVCDFAKEIMIDYFEIDNNELYFDILEIIKSMSHQFLYFRFIEMRFYKLLQKYKKIKKSCCVLPKDYHYESKLYKE
jgi:hypothetical protein